MLKVTGNKHYPRLFLAKSEHFNKVKCHEKEHYYPISRAIDIKD
jgi:hypothetical protein